MPKRNRNQRAQDRRIEEEWAALALESGDDEDFEDDEENYELRIYVLPMPMTMILTVVKVQSPWHRT